LKTFQEDGKDFTKIEKFLKQFFLQSLSYFEKKIEHAFLNALMFERFPNL